MNILSKKRSLFSEKKNAEVHQSVPLDFALIFSESCHPEYIYMDSLVINQYYFSYISWYSNMHIPVYSRLVEIER